MYKSLSAALSLSVFSLIFPVSAKAITLSFAPNSQTAELGDTINVDLVISNFDEDLDAVPVEPSDSESVSADLDISTLDFNTIPALGTFDLVVSFDDSVLDFNSVTFGNELNPSNSILGTTSEIFTPPNSLRLLEISGELPSDLVSSQADRFVLATVSLDAVGLGTSDLVLSDVTLGDENGNPLTANLDSGSVTVEPGSTTTPVPESSNTVSLLALGIGGLLLISHQKKR